MTMSWIIRRIHQASALLLMLLPMPDCGAMDSFHGEWSIAREDRDSDGLLDDTLNVAGLRWYWRAVEIAAQPVAEAAFLQHVGYVDAQAGRYRATYLDRHGAGPYYAISGLLTQPGQAGLLMIAYQHFDVDIELARARRLFAENIGLGAGLYISSSSVLYGQWDHGERTTQLNGIDSNHAQWDTYRLIYRRVALWLERRALALEMGAGLKQIREDAVTSNSSNTVASLALNYYPDPRLSFALKVAQERGEYAPMLGDEWVLSSKLMFQSRLAVELRYQRFNAESDNNNDAAVVLILGGLF